MRSNDTCKEASFSVGFQVIVIVELISYSNFGETWTTSVLLSVTSWSSHLPFPPWTFTAFHFFFFFCQSSWAIKLSGLSLVPLSTCLHSCWGTVLFPQFAVIFKITHTSKSSPTVIHMDYRGRKPSFMSAMLSILKVLLTKTGYRLLLSLLHHLTYTKTTLWPRLTCLLLTCLLFLHGWYVKRKKHMGHLGYRPLTSYNSYYHFSFKCIFLRNWITIYRSC